MLLWQLAEIKVILYFVLFQLVFILFQVTFFSFNSVLVSVNDDNLGFSLSYK